MASVSTSGVLPTGMPRSAAASRSMLSVPTAMFAIAFRPGAASSSSASTAVGDEREQRVGLRGALAQRLGRRRQRVLPDVELVLGGEPVQRRERQLAGDEDARHRFAGTLTARMLHHGLASALLLAVAPSPPPWR